MTEQRMNLSIGELRLQEFNGNEYAITLDGNLLLQGHFSGAGPIDVSYNTSFLELAQIIVGIFEYWADELGDY